VSAGGVEGGGIVAAGAGAAGGGAIAGRAGAELYGVKPGPPGLGPGIPIEFPPDGLTGCAPMGAENASAATTATPVRRCFIFRSSLWLLGMTLPDDFRALIACTEDPGSSSWDAAWMVETSTDSLRLRDLPVQPISRVGFA
jgi:hypothetical protein